MANGPNSRSRKANAKANTSTATPTKDHGLFVHPNSIVLVGGAHVFKPLGAWPCEKCATSNKAQLGFCGTNCGGRPSYEFMQSQKGLQEKRRLELALTPGAAPHDNANNAANKKLAEENKKLRAQVQNASTGNFVADATDNSITDKDFKGLEVQLKAAKAQLDADPGSPGWKMVVLELQTKIEQARPPPKAINASKMHLDVERLEAEVQGLNKAIVRQSEQHDNTGKQIFENCEKNQE
jgi:hypothetical protein